MSEYQHFNGENYITFDLLEIDDDKAKITVAESNAGKISVRTFDLYFDKTNRRYFEYGNTYTKIYIDDFTEEN